MHEMTQDAVDEIAKIIAEVAPLPLKDAAWVLDKSRHRLNTLEGCPTPEQARRFRAMTPEQWVVKYREKRQHDHRGGKVQDQQQSPARHPIGQQTSSRTGMPTESASPA